MQYGVGGWGTGVYGVVYVAITVLPTGLLALFVTTEPLPAVAVTTWLGGAMLWVSTNFLGFDTDLATLSGRFVPVTPFVGQAN